MPVFKLRDLESKCLGGLDNNTAEYPLAEVDYVINEAIRLVALFTGFYKATVQIPGYSVANRLVYNTPPGILAANVISFEGRQLQKVSLRKLARQRRNWATDTTAAYGRVEYWAPVGASKFVISPIDSQGGRDISVTGMAEPPLLVNPDDVMTLENEYVEIIPAYAKHRLPLKEGGKTFADGSLALNDFYATMMQRKRFESLKEFPLYKLVGPRMAPPAQPAPAVAQ
jgi:hypothetical protein